MKRGKIRGAVETAVTVGDAEVLVLSANPNRKNAIVQNVGASDVQVHLTAGLVFGGGGTQWSPKGIWTAMQPGAGVWKGAIYAIRADGADEADVSVTEEV